MTARDDKSHAAAVEFAATHFEQYGLSHLQIGHPWTGVTLADALRAFTPSHEQQNAAPAGEIARKQDGVLAHRSTPPAGAAPSTTPQIPDIGELADVLMDSLREAGYVIGLAAALHVANAVRYRSARSVVSAIRPSTDGMLLRLIKWAGVENVNQHPLQQELREFLRRTDGTAERVKCDYPRCGKAESRCGVCDYKGEKS